MHLSTEARFWLAVKKGKSCWIWTKAVNNNGYGVTYADGKLCLAHRLAWRLTFGPIADGLFVLHRCDRPNCVRPAHLFLGSQSDNMSDCVQKGRLPNSHKAKLTPDKVRTIRTRHAAGESLAGLAREYGMSVCPIHALVHRKTWKHVS